MGSKLYYTLVGCAAIGAGFIFLAAWAISQFNCNVNQPCPNWIIASRNNWIIAGMASTVVVVVLVGIAEKHKD